MSSPAANGRWQALPQELRIFLGVFLYSILFQLVTRGAGDIADISLWSSQVRYVLEEGPKTFDLLQAYGHPNTLHIELAAALHVLSGMTYTTAVLVSMAVLIAGATACCAAICAALFPFSPWWLTTSFLLLLDRPYFGVTPPTAIVIPLTVLTFLTAWWTWERHRPSGPWLVGSLIGLAAATRLSDALVSGTAVSAVLWYRFGTRWVLKAFAASLLVFVLADPYLWYMPRQHLLDLVHKFTVHYAGSGIPPVAIEPLELIRALALSLTCICWAYALLMRHRWAGITLPPPLLHAFCAASTVVLVIVLTSPLQSPRYLAPYIVTWEVLLPLLVLMTFSSASNRSGNVQQATASPLFLAAMISLHFFVAIMFRPHVLSRILPFHRL